MTYDLSSSGKLVNQTMTHLKALAESKHFNLVAAVDNDIGKLEIANRHYSVKTEMNLVDVSIEEKVSLLTVATTTNSHKNLLENLPEFLEPRVLLIEKPVGMNQLDARWVREWARQKSIQVYVNYFRNYLPEVENAKTYLTSLDLGFLISITIESYGELLNIFSHFIELANHITGIPMFCTCTKDLLETSATSFESRCSNCGVIVNLNGVGLAKRTSTITIEFSNYRVEVLNDGMNISVQSSDGVVLQTFLIPIDVYNNYQSYVYDYIATHPLGGASYSGMEQAIRVHDFIESVAFIK
jgi:predicted dehydrogenase